MVRNLKWCDYPEEGTVWCPKCDSKIERIIVNVDAEDIETYCETCGSSIDTVVEDERNVSSDGPDILRR